MLGFVKTTWDSTCYFCLKRGPLEPTWLTLLCVC